MPRVPIIISREPDTFGAPRLAGTLSIHGETWPMTVSLDTMADSMLLSGVTLGTTVPPERWHPVYKQGHVHQAAGVGGEWPSRLFLGEPGRPAARVITQADDREPVTWDVPRLNILAPFRRTIIEGDRVVGRQESLDGQLRNVKVGRTQVMEPAEDAPHLLGRDVFVENRLRVSWDPFGESFVVTPD